MERKENPQMSLFDNPANRSDFNYRIAVWGEGGTVKSVIVITDLNRGRMSVTNNMEAVLQHIADEEGFEISSITGARIIYRDSEGIWDGVEIDPDGQVSFYPLAPEKITDENLAIDLAGKGK
jgi:hypothetical protein